MAKLEVHHLTASYSNSKDHNVLHRVTFNLDGGQVLLLHGRNGSGKSTLLRVLACLIPATEGYFTWNGQRNCSALPGQPTPDWVGFQMQAKSVFRSLKVCHNIELAVRRKAPRNNNIPDRILDEFPILRPMWNKQAGLLSSGQRKVLALAMATIGDPPLLLLDEPLAELSIENSSRVQAFLQARKQAGVTMIVVEHSATRLHSGLADLHAEMTEGRLSPPCIMSADQDKKGVSS